MSFPRSVIVGGRYFYTQIDPIIESNGCPVFKLVKLYSGSDRIWQPAARTEFMFKLEGKWCVGVCAADDFQHCTRKLTHQCNGEPLREGKHVWTNLRNGKRGKNRTRVIKETNLSTPTIAANERSRWSAAECVDQSFHFVVEDRRLEVWPQRRTQPCKLGKSLLVP